MLLGDSIINTINGDLLHDSGIGKCKQTNHKGHDIRQ